MFTQTTRALALTTTALFCSTSIAAADWPASVYTDPHLNTVPRTAQEASRIVAARRATSDFSTPEPFEAHPAGAATTRARTDADAFSQHSGNLSFEQELEFKLGNALFEKIWVFAPASTKASDGLGPLYNARSCQRCHLKDGRGHTPQNPDDTAVSMFLRVSVPGPVPEQVKEITDYIGDAPEPNYGRQLQDFSPPGMPPEYSLSVTYKDLPVPLSDGTVVTLRKPTYQARDLGFGPLHSDVMMSPRVAPPMVGLGLLEAIPAADILANVDEDDANGDGISGRANLVWSQEFQQILLGRFGLKAGSPTVHEQSAAAFSGDIGISTPLFPAHWGECTAAQVQCRTAPHGDDVARGTEIDQPNMDLVTFYSRNLAVPARRNLEDPAVLRGKELFYDTGCTSCHTPKFVTHRLTDRDEHSFQLIWPYSDMLLHDMGDGLADNRPEARATGQEWRTPPLWGIGLTKQVSPLAGYLHDGRARTLLEAILWHGGEAAHAQARVVQMSADERADLLKFLESL